MSANDELVDDLSIAIAQTRGGQRAGELAEEIIRKDHRLLLLVGLTDDGESVVYYDAGLWDILEVPIQGKRVGGIGSSMIDRKEHWGDLEEWVREVGRGRWDWLHPRFRWVFGIDFRRENMVDCN